MGFFSRLFGLDGASANPATVPNHSVPGEDMALDAKTASAVLAEIDIETAIAAHENWKLRLQNYIAGTSTETLQPEVICLDDRCDLGKWLHGPGRERLGRYPAFSILMARHKYFHVQASSVVAQAQGGDMSAAMQTLNGPYRQASSQVVLMLKELKRGLQR